MVIRYVFQEVNIMANCVASFVAEHFGNQTWCQDVVKIPWVTRDFLFLDLLMLPLMP